MQRAIAMWTATGTTTRIMTSADIFQNLRRCQSSSLTSSFPQSSTTPVTLPA